MANILKLVAQVGLDGRGFRAGLKEAGKHAEQFTGNLKSQLAGAFSAAAVTAFLKNVADTIGRIKDLSDQYSITTDEMQRADVALKKNGLEFENLGQAIGKLGQARRDAVEGNDELRATFARYGMSLKDLNNPQLRTYDLLLKLSDAIKDQNLTARDQVELTDLLGQKSLRLISTLQELSNYNDIKLFNPEEIRVLDEANKKWDELIRKAKIYAAELIVEKAPNIDWKRDILRPIVTGLFPSSMTIGPREKDPTADPKYNAPPLTLEQIIEANREKRARLAKMAASKDETLFVVDKNKKEPKAPKLGEANFEKFAPRPSGFGELGGFSKGFLNAFDPRMVVEQSQLSELQKVNATLNDIKNKLDTNSNNDWASWR